MSLFSQNYRPMNVSPVTKQLRATGFELLASHWRQLFLSCWKRWFRGLFLLGTFFFAAVLLIHPRPRNSHSQSAYSSNHADALSHGNRAARIENVEVVRALEAQIVGTEKREAGLLARDAISIALVLSEGGVAVEQTFALGLAQLEVFPSLLNVSYLKVVDRELPFLGQTHIAIFHFLASHRVARPHNFVNRIHVLQEGAQAL